MPKIHGFVKGANADPLREVALRFIGRRTQDKDEVKSSSEGEYLTKNLKNGDYDWIAEKQGFVPGSGLIRLRGTAEVLEHDLIVLEQAGSISGQVTDRAGNGVKQAEIKATDAQNQEHGPVKTDVSGNYSIPNLDAGRYMVSVRAPGGFQNPAPASVNVRAGQDAGNTNFRLAPTIQTGSISGQVTDQASSGVPGAQVMAIIQQNQIAGQAATDVNGNYLIPNVVPGIYTVSVQAHAGFLNSVAIIVNVHGGIDAANTNFQLAPAVQAGSMTGRVTDSAGNGMQGRAVTVARQQIRVVSQALTDFNGDYIIQNLPADAYTVAVTDVTGQPSFLPAHNVGVIAGETTTGIDFSEDLVKDFLGRLDNLRFSIESLVTEDEANQAASLFSVVNLMLAGFSRRIVGAEEKIDILGVLNLYYGLQEDSLRPKITVGNPTALWSNLESELKVLAKDLDQLQSDVNFLNREAKRQFNLGLNNNVLGNVQFPVLFKRYVEIGNDSLLSFDIKAADQNQFFDKTKIGQADEQLKELKGVILQIVRSLSKYGTAATKRVNEDWSKFEARALEVLSIVSRDRVTPYQDEQNSWSVLATLINKNRETEIAPYVVLARHGGKLLKYAMDIYRETKRSLDDFNPEHLKELFQRGNVQKNFWTELIRAEATIIKRYPLANW